jgi:hypothetical protein
LNFRLAHIVCFSCLGHNQSTTGTGNQRDQPSFHGSPETPWRRDGKPEPRAPRSRSKPVSIRTVTRTTSIHCSKRREVRGQTRVGTVCRSLQTSWHAAQRAPTCCSESNRPARSVRGVHQDQGEECHCSFVTRVRAQQFAAGSLRSSAKCLRECSGIRLPLLDQTDCQKGGG